MKDTASVAAALLALTLAGCAATNGSSGTTPRAVAPAGGTLYCLDGKMNETADGYLCTWARSHREACAATETTVVAKSAVATGPTRGGMCPHGERIVHVTTR